MVNLFNKKRVILLLLAVVTVFGLYKIYNITVLSVKTEIAECDTFDETIETEGFAVRDESVISWDGSGNISYKINDGEKVSKGGIISEIYNDIEDVSVKNEITEIGQKIDMFESLSMAVPSDLKKPDVLDKEINDNIAKMELCLSNGDYITAFNNKNKLIGLMSEKKIFFGDNDLLNERIDLLKKRKQELEKLHVKPCNMIYSPNAGWFFRFLDGYENSVDYKSVKNKNIENINIGSICTNKVQENYMGKLINSADWYIIFNITKEQAQSLKKGAECELKLPSMVLRSVPCRVYDLKNDESDNVKAVISCNYMNEEICSFRKGIIKIKTNEYYGFKIKKSAVIYKNSSDMSDSSQITGVNIKFGNIILFKRIKILYSADDYIIADSQPGEIEADQYLKIGDRVVTEGVNLHDGKFIKY